MIIEIPRELFDKFESNMDRINNRMDRLGLSYINYDIIDKKLFRGSDFMHNIPYYIVEVDNLIEDLEFNGWYIRGYSELIEGTWEYSGSAIPNEIKNKHECEHCNVNRKRKYYFVLQHKEGEYKVVGSTCLEDFVYKGERIAYNITEISKLYCDINGLEKLYKKDFKRTIFDVDLVLRIAYVIVNKCGYVKTSEDKSTKEYIKYILNGIDGELSSNAKSILSDSEKITDDMLQKMKDLILNSKDNDFIYKLKRIIEEGSISMKAEELGYMGYVPVMYDKRYNRHSSDYLSIGEQFQSKVKVIGVFKTKKFRYIMLDNNSNKLILFSNVSLQLEKNKYYDIRFIVTKHNLYNNERQNIIKLITNR